MHREMPPASWLGLGGHRGELLLCDSLIELLGFLHRAQGLQHAWEQPWKLSKITSSIDSCPVCAFLLACTYNPEITRYRPKKSFLHFRVSNLRHVLEPPPKFS